MEERNVYRDISRRTDGDVYIGVVGPVRTGKSTFIKKFMDSLVLPNITDEAVYRRTLDELPQSASGRTIMTTEPKFIPEESVEVDLGNNTSFRVRMIDCVGYIVDSAIGYSEDEQPRMVKTPWFDKEIPFDDAAEIGTKKVITDHSTIYNHILFVHQYYCISFIVLPWKFYGFNILFITLNFSGLPSQAVNFSLIWQPLY